MFVGELHEESADAVSMTQISYFREIVRFDLAFGLWSRETGPREAGVERPVGHLVPLTWRAAPGVQPEAREWSCALSVGRVLLSTNKREDGDAALWVVHHYHSGSFEVGSRGCGEVFWEVLT